MNTSKVIVMAGVLLLALAGNTAVAQGNFYVFGAIGSTSSDVSLGGLNKVDGRDTSYLVGAGFALNRSFAIEASYLDFGDHDGETDCPPGFTCLVIPVQTQADMKGLSLAVTGSFPLSGSLDAYGKLGFVSWDINYSGISSAFDASGEDLLYGVGLRHAINDHWMVFAEYERVQLDLGNTSIGVSYQF